MTRAAQIRQWLADNPGWHFMGDVCAGLGATGQLRNAITRDVDQMARRHQLLVVGKHGTKRYSFGRDARQYKTNQQGVSHAG
jgi:uncharacterized Ntn-hydrolase superfamily protein